MFLALRRKQTTTSNTFFKCFIIHECLFLKYMNGRWSVYVCRVLQVERERVSLEVHFELSSLLSLSSQNDYISSDGLGQNHQQKNGSFQPIPREDTVNKHEIYFFLLHPGQRKQKIMILLKVFRPTTKNIVTGMMESAMYDTKN